MHSLVGCVDHYIDEGCDPKYITRYTFYCSCGHVEHHAVYSVGRNYIGQHILSGRGVG